MAILPSVTSISARLGSEDALLHTESVTSVNSWNEFSPLREIVVGDATNAGVPHQTDPSAWLNDYPELSMDERRGVGGRFPTRVIEETNEDLADLVSTLRELGVVVHQPAASNHEQEFGGPGWRSQGRHSYCPRDLALIVGSTIIETPSPSRSRYFELSNLRALFQNYLTNGAHWLSAPRPELRDDLFLYDSAGNPQLGECEPAFEAANVLRLGNDVFYQVSRSGNELGLLWLRSTLKLLGDIRVHPLRGLYQGTHIDSTICFLRPGLVLLNPDRVNPANIPEVLRGWDIVWCPPIDEPLAPLLPRTLSTPWVGMNLLMINPELAIVDKNQPNLIRLLESKGITVLPRQLRHSRVLGGGFHCVTLDTVREGGPENYLD